ncbi:MAG: hypothetical protein HZA20_08260 [Nitrospirae bacterium]|jgi:hypothetical protein|nr:hypothetical protein [Nitrospirota bacterium]
MYDYFQLIGNNVEVIADGMVYRGRLIEIGETDLHLETDGGWLTIPVERVSSVELAEEQ